MKGLRIAIVLPCYNPLKSWDKSVIEQFRSLEESFSSFQLSLVVVDDGSNPPIQSKSIEKALDSSQFKFVAYDKNEGKGFALRKGVSSIDADIYLLTDIDFPYTEQSIKNMVSTLTLRNFDVVVGERTSVYYDSIPFARKIISKLLIGLNKWFLKLKISDTQCGLKVFNEKGAAEFLKTSLDGYLFDVEFIKLLQKSPHITVGTCQVELREGIRLSEVNGKLLFKEMKNFMRLLFS